jgi:hypothetical protein
MEESCEAQSNRAGNEEIEIKLESDSPCTFAYSVTFKEEHGQVKEEITEEQGWIYPKTTEGEDQLTNEGKDLNVVEMKYEVEEDNKFQVTTEWKSLEDREDVGEIQEKEKDNGSLSNSGE